MYLQIREKYDLVRAVVVEEHDNGFHVIRYCDFMKNSEDRTHYNDILKIPPAEVQELKVYRIIRWGIGTTIGAPRTSSYSELTSNLEFLSPGDIITRDSLLTGMLLAQ